jgi:hypothetical protein
MATKKKDKTKVVGKSLADIPAEVAPKPKRPKQTEIPLKGEGVEGITDETLIALGDEFITIRDKKATLATELKETETKILDRMEKLKIQTFRFSDQLMSLKTGATHVKVKTIKVDDALLDAEKETPALGTLQ